MHIDLDRVEPSLLLKAEVCVIGAGVAGLLLAVQLAEAGRQVLLLEAGGLQDEARSQSLYDAVMSAAKYTGASDGRFRVFGGSSTRWGGQLLPYTVDIFSPPQGVPSAAWPIGEEELTGYYDELQRLLGADLLPFDASLLPALGRAPIDFSPEFTLRFSKWLRFGRRNFAQSFGKAALANPRITVVTHANVAELVNFANQVTHARVLDYSRREFRAEAQTFVVATGTIESARLLLLSPSVPNQHGQFGRYFHDHLSWPAAEFRGEGRRRMLQQLGPMLVKGTLHTFKLEASPELRAREQLLAVMAHITIEEPEDSGAGAIKRLLASLQRREPGTWRKDMMAAARALPDVVRVAYAATVQKRRAVSSGARVRLHIDLEQPAEATRCVGLSQERDALGLPKATVAWHSGEAEADTARRYARLVRQQLEALGMAPEGWTDMPHFTDTFHAMGGLRMGDDPRSSVVDTTLRVHGVENLYVASCAVFPSGGSSNPTFTLMCLALRLARQLAR